MKRVAIVVGVVSKAGKTKSVTVMFALDCIAITRAWQDKLKVEILGNQKIGNYMHWRL